MPGSQRFFCSGVPKKTIGSVPMVVWRAPGHAERALAGQVVGQDGADRQAGAEAAILLGHIGGQQAQLAGLSPPAARIRPVFLRVDASLRGERPRRP